MKRWFVFALSAGIAVAVAACSSNSTNARACCSGSDDAGVSFCVCQAVGAVQMGGGFTSTLTVNGTSCTTATTLNGVTSTQAGTVVSSCPD